MADNPAGTVKDNGLMHVFSTLGTIFVPAGVIGLVCSAVGVETKEAASYSLVVTVFIAIIVFREFINKRVSSFIVLLFTLCGLSLLVYFYDNPGGVSKLYEESNSYLSDDLKKGIDGSKQEIIFFGTAFHISAGDRKELLISKLESGVNVKYLILDPSAPFMEERARGFKTTQENLEQEISSSLKSILHIKKLWESRKANSSKPGNLEIRLYNDIPYMRAYIFDPLDSSSESYVVPYINRLDGPNSAGLLLKHDDSGLFPYYLASVRKIWSDARLLSDFIREHPSWKL